MQPKFCPHCGTTLIAKDNGGRPRPACPACGYVHFGAFSLAVGGLLWHEGRVLLAQRGIEPGKGRWTLPGGYVEQDETPDAAVAREVFEETGLRVRALGLVAARHTLRDADQNTYLVLAVALDGPADIQVDGVETLQAGFFTLEEASALETLSPLSRWIVGQRGGVGLAPVPQAALIMPLSGYRWTLYGADDRPVL
jgi:ADP-ribose pyrophosphatase YjhB (NUDIX family)